MTEILTSELKNALYVFFISMLPIVELRGSIPVGATLELTWWVNYLVSAVGNLLPVPFILLFIRAILRWMKTVRFLKFDKIAMWVEEKAHKHSGKVQKYGALGLYLFVAIPIPGTGAWTGALIAALFDVRMKKALPAIALGVLTAGVIMTLASYGFIGFLRFLLPS